MHCNIFNRFFNKLYYIYFLIKIHFLNATTIQGALNCNDFSSFTTSKSHYCHLNDDNIEITFIASMGGLSWYAFELLSVTHEARCKKVIQLCTKMRASNSVEQ